MPHDLRAKNRVTLTALACLVVACFIVGLACAWLTPRLRGNESGTLTNERVNRGIPVSGEAELAKQLPELERIQADLQTHAGLTAFDLPNSAVPLPVPDSDTEWTRMRKERFDFLFYMKTSAVALKGNKLFRHKTLNPRDIYIPPDKRKELLNLVDPYVRSLKEMLDARGRMSKVEFEEMVERGLTRTVACGDNLGDNWSEILGKEIGSEFDIQGRIGNTMHLARSADMPGTSIVAALMHDAGGRLSAVILTWFYNHGYLGDAAVYAKLLAESSAPTTWRGRR